jgi:serine/threonine protein phosphatase PrpC
MNALTFSINPATARSYSFMRMPFTDYALHSLKAPHNWLSRTTLEQARDDMAQLQAGTLKGDRRTHILSHKQTLIANAALLDPDDSRGSQRALNKIRFLDPAKDDDELMMVSAMLRDRVFNGPLDVGYSECFPADNYSVSIQNKAGQSVMAGTSHPKNCKIAKDGSIIKPSDDCAAIGRTADGAEFMIACDGVGSSRFSDMLSEVVSHVVAEEMAKGYEFGSALNKACAIWRERQSEILLESIMDSVRDSTDHYGIDQSNHKKLMQDIWSKLYKWLDRKWAKNLIYKVIKPLLKTSPNQRAFYQDLEQHIMNSLLAADPRKMFITKRPRTTIVGAHRYTVDGKTYAALYNLGDSDARLYKREPDGSLTLVAQNKPHSYYEENKEILEPYFEAQAKKMAQSDDQVQAIKSKLIRNHDISYRLEKAVDPAVDVQEASKPVIVELEEGEEYIVMVGSDYIVDNLDDNEIELALTNRKDAKEALDSLMGVAKKKLKQAQRINKRIKKAKDNVVYLKGQLRRLENDEMPWFMGTAKDTQKTEWERQLQEQYDKVAAFIVENPFRSPEHPNENMTLIDGIKDDDKTVWIAYWRG